MAVELDATNPDGSLAPGDLIEVSGKLKPGDQVVRRATDEIREGTPIAVKK